MNNFVTALEKSIETKNWYSVLFISLTLPDICGKVDDPSLGSKARSIKWFKEYLEPEYTRQIGGFDVDKTTFLSAEDFYALRCAYLHEGISDISGHKPKILERFEFVQPVGSNASMHMNLYNGKILQVQVDRFGQEIVEALKKWLDVIKDDKIKLSKIQNMLNIHMMFPGVGISLNITT